MTRIIVVKNQNRNSIFAKKDIKYYLGLSQRVNISGIDKEAKKVSLSGKVFRFMEFDIDPNHVAVANVNGTPVLGKLLTLKDNDKRPSYLKMMIEFLASGFDGSVIIERESIVLPHEGINADSFRFDAAVFVPLQERLTKENEEDVFEGSVLGMFKNNILSLFTEHNFRVGDWQIDPESPHCAFRAIEETGQRVAFIEKTPRILIQPKEGNMSEIWHYGPRGSGGPDGHIPENQLYGFDPDSRAWCDKMLQNMGYYA